jgi:hypothetical protein
MLNKQAYNDYLIEKKRNEKLITERLGLLDKFNAFLSRTGLVGEITENDIFEFTQPKNNEYSAIKTQKSNELFLDYSAFIKNECPNPLANLIDEYYQKLFEKTAKCSAEERRNDILPTPSDFKVDEKHLAGLTNDEFVSAFKELQQTVTAIYEDIEKSPFQWGYPDFLITEGYYNRVMDILFEFVFNGSYCDGVLTVETKKFFAGKGVKRHKKVEHMIAGFENFGFLFDGFNKKSESFRVSFPDNPHVMAVLTAYTNEIDTSLPDWAWGKPRHSLSYRYMEDPSTQQYESVFLAEMDYASDKFREIQYWLHDEATKYGFYLDPKSPKSLQFKKGSKEFFFVAEKVPNGLYGGKGIYAKVSFLKAFETEPNKMKAFCKRFSHVFRLEDKGKCCSDSNGTALKYPKCMFRMRFTFEGVSYLRCGLKNFIFDDIDLDDVKAILEMFVIENKLKRCAV